MHVLPCHLRICSSGSDSQFLSSNAELDTTAYLLGLLLLVVIPADFCLISISDHKLVTTTPVHEPFLYKQTKSMQAFNAQFAWMTNAQEAKTYAALLRQHKAEDILTCRSQS